MDKPVHYSKIRAKEGEANRDLIRRLLKEYPGIRNRQIIAMTGLADSTVSTHIRAIRDEWAAEGDAE